MKTVSDGVGVSKAHIWEIEKERTRNPATDLVHRLENHFETAVSFFIGEGIDKPDDEKQLARMFRETRQLNDDERKILDCMVKMLLDQKKKREVG